VNGNIFVQTKPSFKSIIKDKTVQHIII